MRAVEIAAHNFCEATVDPFADGLLGYRVYVDAGDEHLVYAYALDPIYARGRIVRCWDGAPRRDAASHTSNPSRDLLSVPPGPGR